ncbi:MAG: flagellar type III secretion system pore protein FliP [Janthinobacterium sp.]
MHGALRALVFLVLALALWSLLPHAEAANIPLLESQQRQGVTQLSVKTEVLVLMTLLGLLPMMALMMTTFTRFIIVLALLRSALGLQQGLPTRVLTGVALILTLLVMRPVGDRLWTEAFEPYEQDKISLIDALRRAEKPMSDFLLAQTHEAALKQVSALAKEGPVAQPADHAFTVKVAAFVLSELKTAFMIGCVLFIPFLVIDLVVSSVLMAMGMMMLSPLVISLPFKILLFVLVDGWSLTVNTLVTSVQGL